MQDRKLPPLINLKSLESNNTRRERQKSSLVRDNSKTAVAIMNMTFFDGPDFAEPDSSKNVTRNNSQAKLHGITAYQKNQNKRRIEKIQQMNEEMR